MDDMLDIKGVSVQYKIENTTIQALDDVSLSVPSKGNLGIVGESGSGKTTLGMCIMNLIEPPGKITEGEVRYKGKNVLNMTSKELKKFRWEEVSMIYQSAMNSLNPVKTISQPIVEVLRSHERISRREARERTVELLSEVGIKPDRASSYPYELSGGMRQRVIIALALALSPKILIADEPTSALDVVTQKQIIAQIKNEITQRGLSLIYITHEIALLTDLVEQVAVTYAGEIAEYSPLKDVLSEPLHPYTKMLLGTVLTFDSSMKELSNYYDYRAGLKEAGPAKQTNACKYANRCKYAFDRCLKERPLLKETESRRFVACHKYN